VPDQLFVKFRAGVAAAAASDVHRQAGATVFQTIAQLGVQVVRLVPGTTATAAMTVYRASSQVEYVDRVPYAYRMITPDDPSFGSQWHYPQIGLPTAWDTITGAGVIVAVIDSGMRMDHPDLAGVAVPGFDFIDNTANGDGDGEDSDPTDPGCPDIDPTDLSHGTHVSGTVAARTNNAVGVAGVNWGGASPTRIMPLRVLGQVMPFSNPLNCGVGTFADIAQAITYAADHGAKVVNMSLGASGITSNPAVDAAISYARSRGVTLVAAAGNDGNCSATGVSYPANNPQVIAVGATTISDTRASYSNCGTALDVTAPGGSGAGGVLSTTWSPNAGFVYASFQGTSMATPHVAGVAALMYGRGITDPATIQTTLQSTALDLGSAGFDNEYGWGRIRADMAVSGGSAAAGQCAFSGVLSGGTITRQSDMRQVAGNGTYTITNAQSGVKSVFVWQDVDGNGSVNTGDIYGETTGVAIFNAQTTSGVTVTVQTRTSGMPTLAVPGGTASCAP
jgi:serine protease